MIDNTRNQSEITRTRSQTSPFMYFLVGGGIGAVLGLLFAPKSGVELRTDISDLTKKGYDESIDLAHQIKEQSAEVLHSLKEKTGRVYDLAATKWANSEQALLPGELINGATKGTGDASSHQKTQPQKPTNIH